MSHSPPSFPQSSTWNSDPTCSGPPPPALPPRGPPPPIPPRPSQYPSAQQSPQPPTLPPRRAPVASPPSTPAYTRQTNENHYSPPVRLEDQRPNSPAVNTPLRRVPPPPPRVHSPQNPHTETVPIRPACQPVLSNDARISSSLPLPSPPPSTGENDIIPPFEALRNMSITSPPSTLARATPSVGLVVLENSATSRPMPPPPPPPSSRTQEPARSPSLSSPHPSAQPTSQPLATPPPSTVSQPTPPTPVSPPLSTTIPTAASFASPWPGVPTFCPTSSGQFHLPGAQWHGIPTLGPTFRICHKCFQTQIAPSRFAAKFSSMPVKEEGIDPAHPPTCQFFTRRSRRLWKEALKTGDLGPFEAYVRARGTLPVCAGSGGVKGGDPIAPPRWYGPAPVHLRSFPDLRICAACYEDEMIGTQAEAHLAEVRTIVGHPRDVVWTCAYAQQFPRGCLVELAQGSATWDAMVNAINNWKNIPKCPGPGQGVSPTSRAWFRPKPNTQTGKSMPVPGMVVCAGCYLDYILVAVADETPGLHQDMFVRVPDEETKAAATNKQQWSCDMCHPAVLVPCVQMSYRPQGEEARRRGWDDERMWRTTARMFLSDASCFTQGGNAIKQGADVYKPLTLSAEPLDFEVCASCYTSYAVAMGAERFLVKAPASSNGNVRCDMGVRDSPRFGVLFYKWMASVGMGDVRIFETYVRERWRLPACPRDNRVQEGGRMWYGTGMEFVCCPERYLDVVKGSELDGALTMRDVYEPSPLSCILYSPRARAQWAEACAINSLPHFIALQQPRRTAYAELMPRLSALTATWNRRLQERQRLLNEATQFMNMARSSSASSMMAHSTQFAMSGVLGSTYTGNDGLGQLAGSFMRQADDARRRANAIVVVTEEERAEEAELLGRWKEVE